MEIEAPRDAVTASEEHLLLRQVQMLYRNTPTSVAANVLGTVFALVFFLGQIPTWRLITWATLVLGVTVGRYLDFYCFKNRNSKESSTDVFYRRFFLGSSMTALAAGSAGILLFSTQDLHLQVTLALMIVCIAAFSTTTLAPRKEIVISFLLILFGPLFYSLLTGSTQLDLYMFWMLLVLLVLLILSAIRINDTLSHSISNAYSAIQQERELNNSLDRLNIYFHSTPIALIEWDAAGKVLQWNEAAEKTFGYSADEATGKTADQLIIPKERNHEFEDVWTRLVNQEGVYSLLKKNVRKDGELIMCQWVNTVLRNSQDAVVGVVSHAEDVTKKLEGEQIKNEFMSVVSHELRTPITSLKGSLGLLASDVLADDPEKAKEILDLGLRSVNRLQLLLNDILDAEKLKLGKMSFQFQETSISEILQDAVHAVEGLTNKNNVRVELTPMAEDNLVYVDPVRINQVLTNMLSNAIKFSEKNSPVKISCIRSEGQARFTVHNRGDVIPAAKREALFAKFSQLEQSNVRREQGTGLGLFISQEILNMHKSFMDFRSNQEEGTTFFFYLDIHSPPNSSEIKDAAAT